MGTPHLGADIAAATRFLRNISNVITMGGVRSDLLEVLQRRSKELQDISQRFVRRAKELQIVSMYEQNRTKRILVVDRDSATLGIPNERLFAIPRDHREICKYSKGDESIYATVSGAVVELLEDIHQLSCT